MSNSLAIAAVTATLRDLLSRAAQPLPGDPSSDTELADLTVTARPPDKARSADDRNQLNLFLYHTTPNAAWRNRPLGRSNEAPPLPLALNLYYLVTAYGRGSEDLLGHRLLGRAMGILHDHGVLLPADIRTALTGNDLHLQIDRVRVTPHHLSPEELSRLWAIFQTQYRLSAAYEASVILIESSRPARAPLPVLARGPSNMGPIVRPYLGAPFPLLTALVPPHGQPAVRLGTEATPGDTLIIQGANLEGGEVRVEWDHRLLATPCRLAPVAGASATELRVELPTAPAGWVAGVYSLTVVVQGHAQPEARTNALPLTLAPRILSLTPNPAARDSAGNVTLIVTCSPHVQPEQRVSLIVGSAGFRAEERTQATDTLTFSLQPAPAGQHFVRLRVDGIDSLLVNYSVTPPVFDETQQVTLS